MLRTRRVIAVALLATCLALVLAGSAQAWSFDRGERAVATVEVESELSFWQQLWQRFQALWRKQSVLIDPNGGNVTEPPSPEET